jgi:hypothetical protein
MQKFGKCQYFLFHFATESCLPCFAYCHSSSIFEAVKLNDMVKCTAFLVHVLAWVSYTDLSFSGWLRHYATSQKVTGSIPDVTGFFS